MDDFDPDCLNDPDLLAELAALTPLIKNFAINETSEPSINPPYSSNENHPAETISPLTEIDFLNNIDSFADIDVHVSEQDINDPSLLVN